LEVAVSSGGGGKLWRQQQALEVAASSRGESTLGGVYAVEAAASSGGRSKLYRW